MQDPRRHSYHRVSNADVTGHDGACAHHGISCDLHLRQDARSEPQLDAVSDDGLPAQTCPWAYADEVSNPALVGGTIAP